MATGSMDLPDILRLSGVCETIPADLPAWLWDIDAGRILFANAAGVSFFREDTLMALRGRGFDMRRSGMVQLERAARTLPRDGTPRLSMLRFFVGLRDVPIACSCRLVSMPQDRLVVLVCAVDGPRDRRTLEERAAILFDDAEHPVALVRDGAVLYGNAAAAAAPSDTDDPVFMPAPLEPSLRLVLGGVGAPAAAPALADRAETQPEPPAQHDTEDLPAVSVAEPMPAIAAPEPRRFSFALDAEGRFVEIGPALAEIIGSRSADVVGRLWTEVAASSGFDPEGRIAAALSRREAWGGVVLQWPTDNGSTATVQLAAHPRLGNGRVFAGFRGFGDVVGVKAENSSGADVGTAGIDPDAVFVDTDAPAPSQPAEDHEGEIPHLRPVRDTHWPDNGLNRRELTAFEAIAKALGARLPDSLPEEPGNTQQAAKTVSDSPPLDAAPDDEPAPEPDATSQDTGHESEDQGPANVAAVEDMSGTAEPAEDETTEAETAEDETVEDETVEDETLEDETVEDETVEEEADPRSAHTPEGTGDDAEPEILSDDAPPAAANGVRETGIESTASEPAIDDAAMQKAESVVSSVLDRLPLGIAIVREERIIYANRAFLEIFDYSDIDDLEIAGGLSVLFEGRSAEALGAAVTARRRDGELVTVEARLGRTPWLDGPAMFVTARELAGTAHDASDDETDEQSLAEIAELRTVLDTATDGVLVLSADGTVEVVNRSAQALFGRDASEITGRSFCDLVAEESRPAVRDYLDGLASGGVMSVLNDGREIVARAKGGEVPLFLTIGRIGDSAPPRFCAVMRDLTDWKAAEAELTEARKRAEAASEQKSDFLAKMSHEIRTPLNAIIGFAEVILEERFGPVGNDRYREYVKDIRASGEHIMSLVNDLLDLSKVEAGKLELNFTGVNLNDIVEQSVAIMQPQANRERVIIRSSLARNLPPVVADTRSLRQVMLNLLSNAIKFTPPGGQAIVSTILGDGGDVLLRVRDTGIGMSETDVQSALEPFRQLAVRSETHQRGTGLGLPLTRALVEANRAEFAIRSRVNEGTLVEVCFPQSRVLAE